MRRPAPRRSAALLSWSRIFRRPVVSPARTRSATWARMASRLWAVIGAGEGVEEVGDFPAEVFGVHAEPGGLVEAEEFRATFHDAQDAVHGPVAALAGLRPEAEEHGVEAFEFEGADLFGGLGGDLLEGGGDGTVRAAPVREPELGGDLVVGGSGFAEFEGAGAAFGGFDPAGAGCFFASAVAGASGHGQPPPKSCSSPPSMRGRCPVACCQ